MSAVEREIVVRIGSFLAVHLADVVNNVRSRRYLLVCKEATLSTCWVARVGYKSDTDVLAGGGGWWGCRGAVSEQGPCRWRHRAVVAGRGDVRDRGWPEGGRPGRHGSVGKLSRQGSRTALPGRHRRSYRFHPSLLSMVRPPTKSVARVYRDVNAQFGPAWHEYGHPLFSSTPPNH